MAQQSLPNCPIPSLAHVQSRLFLDVRVGQGVASSWGVETNAAVVFECPQSGLRFRTPASKEEIERYYGSEYHERMCDAQRSAAYRAENRNRIEHLQRYCATGRVLDVGCSTAIFASQLGEAKFDAYGSDISEYACEQARQTLGEDNVLLGPVESFADEHLEAFDAITLMDVIEHFGDVVGALEAMHRMLVPGGVLFLRTPTLSSPFYKVADLSYAVSAGRYTDAVLKIYHAEHFYFFNERSIRMMLEDTGYEVLSIDPDPLRWDNFRSAEMRHSLIVNGVLGAIYFTSKALGHGHGMKVVARRR